MLADANRGFRRAYTAPGFFLHKLLYNPVFKGMIADDYKPAFIAEQFYSLLQDEFQVLQNKFGVQHVRNYNTN